MGGSVDENASESDKPVHMQFPDPGDDDFDEEIGEEERQYYQAKIKDLNEVKNFKPHCSACDRHLGCSTRNDTKMRVHPMLRTLVCSTCHSFYNSGEFDKGEDGSELYCRWCGQGGQVYCCSDCPVVFCAKCIRRNFGNPKIKEIENIDDWKCFKCNPRPLWDLRAICWALLRYVDLKIKITHKTSDPVLKERYNKDCLVDHSECCKDKKKRTSMGRKKEETKKADVKIEAAKKPDPKIETPVKLPPTIQVKKFAAINVEEPKKAQKRPASPKNKLNFVSKPISITPRLPVNPLYTNFAKRPKMDKEALATTSTDSGLPVMSEAERDWFSRQQGKHLTALEKSCIINIFKMFYQKSLKEYEERMSDATIQINHDDVKRACAKAVAKHLNVSNYLIDKVLKENGILHRPYHLGQVDHLFTKLLPNQYHKERMPFMPLVHSQYMPRRPPPPPMSSSPYPPMMIPRPIKGFNGHLAITADNINLSLESLTQGLDMNAMLANTGRNARAPLEDSQLVCTPDFPLEPLCEVTEENNDDDVECMTPGPVAPPKPSHTSAVAKRSNKSLDSDNIIQMTENDVTVNASTGGLKFRVDPQTLSANKMYRLPDGRVFAINANPKMPGGYSATIVALADEGNKHLPAKGTTYSAKVSAVAKPPKPQEKRSASVIQKANALPDKFPRSGSSDNNGQNKGRKCDLNVPVEWYIYNVTDAIDSLEYTLMRLKKLKKNTNSTFLRTRSVEEVRTLQNNLDRLLANSSTRFSEIRASLGKGFKSYCQRKAIGNTLSDTDTDHNEDDDDDDDVEILADNHDEPIFIDENSVDSNSPTADGQVDLLSSDFNESGDKDKSTTMTNNPETDLNEKTNDSEETISTSNLENEIEKNSEPEKGEKAGIETSEVNTTQNFETRSEPSQQKELAELMETNDDIDGNLEKNDVSGDDAEMNAQKDSVDSNDKDHDKMVTSDIAKEDDEEEKNYSGNCDTTNAENSCEGSDAENSVARDDKKENETNETKKDGDGKDAKGNDSDKDKGECGEEFKDNNDIGDKENNDKDNENEILNDSQDIEKLDEDDIESLLKGGDELDDLASKVQCIVDMDPDLI